MYRAQCAVNPAYPPVLQMSSTSRATRDDLRVTATNPLIGSMPLLYATHWQHHGPSDVREREAQSRSILFAATPLAVSGAMGAPPPPLSSPFLSLMAHVQRQPR